MKEERPVAENLEHEDALFVNLVFIFQNAAMQQMGKITNPLTGKIERNLEQARFSIDMIDMLRSKTRGNVSSDLEKLLDTALTNLRMNFVDEANKAASGEGGEKGEGGPQGKEPEEPAGAEGEGTAGAGGSGGAENTAAADGDTQPGSDRGSASGDETEDNKTPEA
jgi:hypothetical protein